MGSNCQAWSNTENPTPGGVSLYSWRKDYCCLALSYSDKATNHGWKRHGPSETATTCRNGRTAPRRP